MGRIRVAIACAGVLLSTAASARAQTTNRETGSVTTGGYLVWVRGTNASSVELFVGRGFRDAFARAHTMDAAKLQHWIDSVQTVTPIAADDTTSVDAHAGGAAMGTDVTMMRRVGGAHSGLRLLVGGEEPIQMAEPTARDFIVMLDSAARLTLELSKPGPSLMVGIPAPDVAPAPAPVTTVAAIAAPVSAPVSAPAQSSTPVATTVVATTVVPTPVVTAPAVKASTTSVTATASAPAVSAPIAATPPAPVKTLAPDAPSVPAARSTPLIGVPTTTTVIGVPPDSIAAATPTPPPAMPSAAPSVAMGPTTTEAPPELVLAAPSEPVILLASRVEIMPLPMPPVPIPAAKPVVTRPSVDSVAGPVAASVATPMATPIAKDSAPPALTPAPDSAIAPRIAAPADKLIRTPLGPFTVPAALLADRDKEAQYCYTQLGLKYNPDLKGEITVKLSLASDGAVQDAAVTKRSWQGISAGEVESCVRALARDWTFAPTDSTIVDGAKLLTFRFAP